MKTLNCYKIVYNNSVAARYAAAELQNFVRQATGITLPLSEKADGNVFSIGNTEIFEKSNISVPELKNDGFYLKTHNENLFFCAKNDRGLIYAVYDFLEKYIGIKFLSYDETYVPKLQKFILPEIDYFENPKFPFRAYLNSQNYQTYPEFAARSRMVHEHIDIPDEFGGGLGWFKGINPTHNTLQYVNPSDFPNEAHMFCFKDGKAEDICLSDGITDDGKLDESMENSALKSAIESLKGYVKNSPADTNFYMFGQMDINFCCQCARCLENEKKFHRSGMLIRFSNIMATEVQKWSDKELDKKPVNLVVFAYYHSEFAPVIKNEKGEYVLIHPSVKPVKNLYIRIAPIIANYCFSYNDKYQKLKTRELFKSWKAVHDKFMIWSYHSDFGCNFYYMPSVQSWKENLNFLSDLGTEYLMMQAGYYDINNYQQTAESYIASKMLWNPEQDWKKLSREFNKYYFNEISGKLVDKYVERQIKHMISAQKSKKLIMFEVSVWRYCPTSFSINFLKKQQNLLKKAIESVQNNQSLTEERKNLITKRLKLVKLLPDFQIMRAYNTYFPEDQTGLKEISLQFFKDCRETGIINMAEGRKIENFEDEIMQELKGKLVEIL